MLRAEKGFIIVGQETDGTVTPDDLGLAGLIAKAKPDFVGRRSLARPDVVARRAQAARRPPDATDPAEVLDEGAQIVADPRQAVADAHARPRHLELLERDLRALHRPCACWRTAGPGPGSAST